MATPNYGYEKRQRELAKRKKKEEKARAKAAGKPISDAPSMNDGESREEAPEADPGASPDADNKPA